MLSILQRNSKGKRECYRKIERNTEMNYAEIKASNKVLRFMIIDNQQQSIDDSQYMFID